MEKGLLREGSCESYLMTVGKSSAAYTYTASNEMNTKNLAVIAIMIRPAMKPDNSKEANLKINQFVKLARSFV